MFLWAYFVGEDLFDSGGMHTVIRKQIWTTLVSLWAYFGGEGVETEPGSLESRAGFLVRLRRGVSWLNDNLRDTLLKLCTNKKTRAREPVLPHCSVPGCSERPGGG